MRIPFGSETVISFKIFKIHPIVPPFPEYNDTNQSDRILATTIENDTFPYSPLIVPKKYANDLLIHNSDPAMWFMSQVYIIFIIIFIFNHNYFYYHSNIFLII